MLVSCVCQKLPMQNILCRTKPRFVFSLKYNHLCAHTCVCSNLKSLHVSLAQPLPIAKVYLLPLVPTDEKQTVSEGRKNRRQSNPQCLVLCFHLTFSSISWKNRAGTILPAFGSPGLGPIPWSLAKALLQHFGILAALSQEPLLKCSGLPAPSFRWNDQAMLSFPVTPYCMLI